MGTDGVDVFDVRSSSVFLEIAANMLFVCHSVEVDTTVDSISLVDFVVYNDTSTLI